MISLSLALSPSPLRPLKSLNSSFLIPRHTRYNRSRRLNKQSKLLDAKCRAEFSPDAPVAAAIGACILTSYIFPATTSTEDSEGESLISLGDARSAVMAIISFIPYFNWMSWVFAWLDTRKPRYAVYAIAYLAPYLSNHEEMMRELIISIVRKLVLRNTEEPFVGTYLSNTGDYAMLVGGIFYWKDHESGTFVFHRTNFSVSLEESWLPITSMLLCIFHIQVEASARREDVPSSEFREDTAKRLSSMTREKDNSSEKDGKKDSQNPSSAVEQAPKGVSNWESTQKTFTEDEIWNDKEDDNGGKIG